MANHDRDDEMLARSGALRMVGAGAGGTGMLGGRKGGDAEIQELREALRHTQQQLDDVLGNSSEGVIVLDSNSRINHINVRAIQLFLTNQCSPEVLRGANFWTEFPELRDTVLETQFRQAMISQEHSSFEWYYLPQRRWLDVRVCPSDNGLTSYVQDIGRRKSDEQAARDSAQRLQVALAAGRLGDWRWDAGTGLLTVGARAAEIIDTQGSTALAWHTVRERLLPEDLAAASAAFRTACETHTDFNVECRIRRHNGELCWLAVVGHVDTGSDGRLSGMTGMIQDITARRLAEQTLRKSEEALRALANSIPQLAWIAGANGAMLWCNERWYEYTGMARDQAALNAWEETCAPECLPQLKQHWADALASGQPFEMEFPIRGADGQFRWFLTRANPVAAPADGQPPRWLGTSTDVDQVKRAQEELRDQSNALELLNNTGNILAATRDLPTLLQQVTDAATNISGARYGAFFYNGRTPDGEILQLHTLSGAKAEEFDALGHPRATALLGPTMRGQGAIRIDDVSMDQRYGQASPHHGMPGGHPQVRSYLALPVVSRSGEVIGSMLFGHPEPGMFTARTERIVGGIAAQAAVAIDNTRMYEAAQRAAEERKVLLDSERSARAEAERTSQMKDEFLATLSHELRTPLSAILGWSQVLRRGTRDQADLHRGLQTIERNARNQAQLIEDLLDMSRITSGKVLLDMQTLSPASVIDAAIEALRPAAEAKNIRLEKFIADDVGLIAGDPSRLQQVMWNLLSNALKFTPRDGMVRISATRDNAYVSLTVSDTGTGIRPEFLAHVFERFRQADASTTRKHGGLGLGLSIVKHLVEQHGGVVQADSEGEGRGATFTVQLPVAAGSVQLPQTARKTAPEPVPPPAEEGPSQLSGVNVLVVDDEADARELIKRILNDAGAQVHTAGTAAQALQLLLSERPQLMISDIGMPDIDGFELLALVRALGAGKGGDLPAIALTAFARSEDRTRALREGFAAHVAKPVEPAQLIATVSAITARRSA
jgi:PAS domain S-box-containing protein